MTTKEDGGDKQNPRNPKIPKTIEEMIVRRKSTGDPNPTITKDTLIRYFPPNSSIPTAMPLERFLQVRPDLYVSVTEDTAQAKNLEEIKVIGKRLNIPLDLATIIHALQFAWRSTPYGRVLNGLDFIATILDLARELNIFDWLNPDQDLPETEILSFLEANLQTLSRVDPDASKALEELIATQPDFSGHGLENVYVTAQDLSRFANKSGATVNINLSWDQLGQMLTAVANKTPPVRVPLGSMEMAYPINETWVKPYPWNANERAAVSTLPRIDFVSGRMNIVTTDTGIKMSNKWFNKTKEAEENRLRGPRERKYGRSASIYRGILLGINKTFGALDEVQEFINAWLDNMYYGKRKLSSYSLEEAIKILQSGRYTVDMDQVFLDLAANFLEDYMWGKASQLQRQALNEIGYWGPNAGSYMPRTNLPRTKPVRWNPRYRPQKTQGYGGP